MRGDYNFWESARNNSQTYRNFYTRLLDLAVNMIEWEGLPESIDPRYVELILNCTGSAVYFNDPELGDLILRCAAAGPLNVYNIPTRRTAYGAGYSSGILTEKDSVIIYNNYLHTSVMPVLESYALRLYEIERAVDVNVKQQKTPAIIKCSESQRLVMLNLFKKYDGNEPFIFGDKSLNLDGIQVINTNAPYISDKLQILKRQIWNEALTYLGISNSNTEKAERMITDEITTNLGAVQANRYTRLISRQNAADKINHMFGTNITVKYRSDLVSLADDLLDGLEDDGIE